MNLEDFIDTSFEYIKKNYKRKITDYIINDSEYRSQVATIRCDNRVAISGNESQAAINGVDNRITACGAASKVMVCGCGHHIAISGDYSQMASSGAWNQIAINGDFSKVVASGYCSYIAISGFDNIAVVSGQASSVVACGNLNRVVLNGKKSIGTNIGVHGIIKGKKGCWITLAEYDDNYKIKCVKSKKIDGKKLKEDTWYTLKNGKFIEVESWEKFKESITLHIRREQKQC